MITGIVKDEDDKLQPYRVWHNGTIVFFCKTEDEAKNILRVLTKKEVKIESRNHK